MVGAGEWEAVFEKDDHGVAGFADMAHDVLFARTDGGTVGDGSLGCVVEDFAFELLQGFGGDAAAADDGLADWPFEEPVVAEGGEGKVGYLGVAAKLEEVGMGAFDPCTAWVLLDVGVHGAELAGMGEGADKGGGKEGVGAVAAGVVGGGGVGIGTIRLCWYGHWGWGRERGWG